MAAYTAPPMLGPHDCRASDARRATFPSTVSTLKAPFTQASGALDFSPAAAPRTHLLRRASRNLLSQTGGDFSPFTVFLSLCPAYRDSRVAVRGLRRKKRSSGGSQTSHAWHACPRPQARYTRAGYGPGGGCRKCWSVRHVDRFGGHLPRLFFSVSGHSSKEMPKKGVPKGDKSDGLLR